MSNELPDPDDLEIAQLMAAQRVVMNHRDELHQEYLKEVRKNCRKYEIDFPERYEREIEE